MQNNPIRYNDPTGHWLVEDSGNGGCSTSGYCPGSSTYNPPQNDEVVDLDDNLSNDEDDEPNPNDDISLGMHVEISAEIDVLFDPFAGYTPDERQLLNEILISLYGGNLNLMETAQVACDFNNCNNPLNYQDTNPLSLLSPDQAQLITNSYFMQQDNRTAQIFLKQLEADDFSTNPWNHEPNCFRNI